MPSHLSASNLVNPIAAPASANHWINSSTRSHQTFIRFISPYLSLSQSPFLSLSLSFPVRFNSFYPLAPPTILLSLSAVPSLPRKIHRQELMVSFIISRRVSPLAPFHPERDAKRCIRAAPWVCVCKHAWRQSRGWTATLLSCVVCAKQETCLLQKKLFRWLFLLSQRFLSPRFCPSFCVCEFFH